jgi:hypothetical protein
MRCRSCESILWHQPPASPASAGVGRCCSECGAPYRASDYEFVRGKVRFECPHCATGYYGTSPRGHLEPIAFECPGCQNFIHMDECVLRPEGVEHESQAIRFDGVPWLGDRGLMSRWFETVTMGLSRPVLIAERLKRDPRPSAALAFLVLQSWLSVAPVLCCCVFGGSMSLMSAAGSRVMLGEFASVVAGVLLGAPTAAALLAVSAVLGARLASRGDSPPITRDIEIVCYSSGPLAFSAVPVVGAAAYIWWMVAAVIAIAPSRPAESRAIVTVAAVAGFLALPALLVAVLFLTN